MEVGETINESLNQMAPSVLKRLIAQPLNGSSILTLGSSSSSQTRVDIPPCVERLDLTELGFQLFFNSPVGTSGTGNKTVTVMPCSYFPLAQRIEIFYSDSTNKLVEISNMAYYSKETASLFNNFAQRKLEQFCNFGKDTRANIPLYSVGASAGQIAQSTSITIKDDYFNDAFYWNVATNSLGSSVNQVTYSQQQYIALEGVSMADSANANARTFPLYTGTFNTSNGYTATTGFPGNAGNGTLAFNIRLGDIIHDSVLNNMKHIPHATNLTILIFWQPVNQILNTLPVSYTGASGVGTGLNVAGPLAQYTGSTPLSIQNLFVRYFCEENKDLVNELMNSKFRLVYPMIYQSNLQTPGPGGNYNGVNGTLSGVNATSGIEASDGIIHRIYRIYTSLFSTQPAVLNTVPQAVYDNNSNINYNLWNGNVELYNNNDLYLRYQAPYGDWIESVSMFKDGSLNSSYEMQHHGTIVFHFEGGDLDNGRVYEYKNNELKGMEMSKYHNLNPRMLNAVVGGNQYIFYVVLRVAEIDHGKMTVL